MFKIHPKVPECMSDEAKGFIMNCFTPNPDDRATAAELLKDTFLRSSPRKKARAQQEAESKDFLSTGEASPHIKFTKCSPFCLNRFLSPSKTYIFSCFRTSYGVLVVGVALKTCSEFFNTKAPNRNPAVFHSRLSAQSLCAHLHLCGGHRHVLGLHRPLLFPGPQEATGQPESRRDI